MTRLFDIALAIAFGYAVGTAQTMHRLRGAITAWRIRKN